MRRTSSSVNVTCIHIIHFSVHLTRTIHSFPHTGRFAKINPCVVTTKPLAENRYYLVLGRMGAGKKIVDLELFINSATPADKKTVPVNPKANPSKMAVGQERDATNHPGKESFHGEIARLLIYERPLTNEELSQMISHLVEVYKIKITE